MWQKRLCYWACLVGCLIFYFIYWQWFAFMLLLVILVLPWLSLALSYPAMRSAVVTLKCPPVSRIGMPAKITMQVQCRFPVPPMNCKVRVTNGLTGESYVGKPGELLPTEHCGKIIASVHNAWVYDYLGLFRRPLPEKRCVCHVMPKPVAAELPPVGLRNDSALRPKPGGGFSEHHELRLYRPGDALRNVHWKATAKTGKLIYREAMEKSRNGHVLTVLLSGTPKELDRKMGQLLWSSRSLLEQKIPHQIRAMSDKGQMIFSINGEHSLEECLRKLIGLPCTQRNAALPDTEAFWQQTIGGEDHET